MKKIINQELMRITNKKQILEFIYKNIVPISKKDLADKLGLSTTSVTTFINELLVEDKIISCGTAKSTGGRKSNLYKLNPEAFYSLGIELQVDRIIMVLLNFCGELIETREVAFSNKNEWHVLVILNHLIDQIIADYHIPLNKLKGIGIGVPGIVNPNTGILEFAPNLGWKHVNLGVLLNVKAPVIIENEANAAALGEKAFGVARDVSNLLYISIGIGIGCGMLLNGKLFSGNSGHAGEFGHMTIDSNGLPCQCGNRGCWETYASNNAALKLYAQKTGRELLTFDDFQILLTGNDSCAIQVLDTIINYLGMGIASIVNGINPEMIVIGGKIIETDGFYNKLLQQIKTRCLALSFNNLIMKLSGLNNKASALGAASMVMDKLIET
jgi:predicted NBD/HSP70 family sugar kinase